MSYDFITDGAFARIYKFSENLCFKKIDVARLKLIDTTINDYIEHVEFISKIFIPRDINIIIPIQVYNCGFTMQFIKNAITLYDYLKDHKLTVNHLKKILKIFEFCEKYLIIPDLNFRNILIRGSDVFLVDIDSAQFRARGGFFHADYYNQMFEHRKKFVKKKCFYSNHYLYAVFSALIMYSELEKSEKILNWCARVARNQFANFATLPVLKK